MTEQQRKKNPGKQRDSSSYEGQQKQGSSRFAGESNREPLHGETRQHERREFPRETEKEDEGFSENSKDERNW